MDEVQKNQLVTPVGNAWVTCRSKSHQGRIYYFNTLTGEAAWNLSDFEVEKAKKRTQKLAQESVVHLEGCPEPKEPPTDHLDRDNFRNNQQFQQSHAPSPSVCNGQIMSDQFAKPPFPFATLVAPTCTHVAPQCTTLNTGSTLGLSLPTSTYNPNVWTVPPTHQIFIAPSVPPHVNQSHTSMNVAYKDFDHGVKVQNTALPLSRRFEVINHSEYDSPNKFQRGNRFNLRGCNRNWRGQLRRKYQSRSSNDLRQVLAAKRCQQSQDKDIAEPENVKNDELHFEKQKKENDISSKQEISGKCHNTDSDSNWLEDNIHFRGNKLYLDVTNLKNLSSDNMDVNSWYVAADTNIFLNHLNFLNILINSDDQCRLLVSKGVLTELRTLANTSKSGMIRITNHARRAIDFLSQELEKGSARMGEDSLETRDMKTPSVLSCCMNLMTQNYHVVLISNNNGLKIIKTSIKVPIFTITELQDFLSNHSTEEEFKCPKVSTRVIDNALKISTPNGLLRTPVEATICDKQIQNKVLTSTKNTVDAEVQTDQCALSDSAISKKREIRLNRKTSNHATSGADSKMEKKQYKWRKRRTPLASLSSTNDSERTDNVTTDDKTNSTTTESNTISMNNQYMEIQLACKQTDETLHNEKYSTFYDDNVEGSESGSSVFIQKSIPMDKIIIEETSTSGVISNSASNVDSESDCLNSSRPKPSICSSQPSKTQQNVMFEITGRNMEEYLKMKCDEWVSRFFQIMEEVLTQVLQYGPPFVHHNFPPPWTLHEATKCVQMKFNDNCDIVCAAKQLSSVLFTISDGKGRISMEIKPSEYMKMYSYGVHLVDSLQRHIENFEDLHTAAESLSRLLNDIQDPNMDLVNTDSFVDNLQDCSANNLQSTAGAEIQDNVNLVSDYDNKEQQNSDKINEKSSDSYNLRSKRRKLEQEKEQTEVKFIRNIDIKQSFFLNLDLKKNDRILMGNAIQNSENLSADGKSQSTNIQHDKNSGFNDLNLNSDRAESISGDFEQKEKTVETKFIRNFSKCAEFEERLQRASKQFDLDELDYSGYYDYEYMGDEYCSEDEYCENEQEVENDEVTIGINSSKIESPKLDVNGNSSISCVFRTVINDIKEAFVQVNKFCEKSYEDLNNSLYADSKKVEIYEKAEKAHLCIHNISKSLNSIYYRESIETENNIKFLLNQAGIDRIDYSDQQFAAYRDVVAKCMEQANILRESINIILDVVKP